MAHPLEPGFRIGDYELVRAIGSGGMAEVWVAKRRRERRATKYVAIKLVADKYVGDERYQRMFRAEADLSTLLNHANVVQVFDEGLEDGRSYLVMEWVDGANLLKVEAALTFIDDHQWRHKVTSYIIGQLLYALDYAHSITLHNGNPLGIVHRDVSPQNILVSIQGEVKLTDFGVAHYLLEESSGVHVKGKIRYMAPEQIAGKTRDPRVDLYAVGAVLHELLDGRRFRHQAEDQRQVYLDVLGGVIPPMTQPVPPHLDELRLGLLEPDPSKRIPSASAALDLLLEFPGYGDARRELAQICGALTGVMRPRAGMGSASVDLRASPAPAPQQPAEDSDSATHLAVTTQRVDDVVRPRHTLRGAPTRPVKKPPLLANTTAAASVTSPGDGSGSGDTQPSDSDRAPSTTSTDTDHAESESHPAHDTDESGTEESSTLARRTLPFSRRALAPIHALADDSEPLAESVDSEPTDSTEPGTSPKVPARPLPVAAPSRARPALLWAPVGLLATAIFSAGWWMAGSPQDSNFDVSNVHDHEPSTRPRVDQDPAPTVAPVRSPPPLAPEAATHKDDPPRPERGPVELAEVDAIGNGATTMNPSLEADQAKADQAKADQAEADQAEADQAKAEADQGLEQTEGQPTEGQPTEAIPDAVEPSPKRSRPRPKPRSALPTASFSVATPKELGLIEVWYRHNKGSAHVVKNSGGKVPIGDVPAGTYTAKWRTAGTSAWSKTVRFKLRRGCQTWLQLKSPHDFSTTEFDCK